MHEIRDLLTKKKLSGQDVGRAIIVSLAHDLANEAEPLFTQDELENMKRALSSEKDITEYNEFVALESRLVLYQALQQGFYQQAQNGLFRINASLVRAKLAVTTRAALLRTPALVTPTRYAELMRLAKDNGTDILHEFKKTMPAEEDINFSGAIAVIAEPYGLGEPVNGQYKLPILEELVMQVKDYDIYDEAFTDELTALARDGLLYPALRQLYAFNAVYDMLADFLNIADIAKFKLDLTFCEEQIESYNETAKAIVELAAIAAGDVDSAKLQSRLHAVFRPLNYAAQRPEIPPPEAIKAKLPALLSTRGTPLELLSALNGKETP